MSELSSVTDVRREIDILYSSIPAPHNRAKSLTLECELSAVYDLLQTASELLSADNVLGARLTCDRVGTLLGLANGTIVRNRARARSTTS